MSGDSTRLARPTARHVRQLDLPTRLACRPSAGRARGRPTLPCRLLWWWVT